MNTAARPGLIALAVMCCAAAPTPRSADAELEETLVRLREGLRGLRAYEATVHRTTEITDGEISESAEATVTLSLEKPNRLTSLFEGPEGGRGVICDGERLVVWSEALGQAIIREAPGTLAEVLEESLGLAAEGLVIGGLLLSEAPLEELTQDFDVISDLGRQRVNGRMCRLLGLERPLGLRMILWIDEECGVPTRATLDASATLRDWATAINVNSGGLRVTVTEVHTDVRIDPTDLVFQAAIPPSMRTVSQFTASPEVPVSEDSR